MRHLRRGHRDARLVRRHLQELPEGRPRALPLPPALVERSRARETRGVNDVKRGLNAIGGGYEGATFDAVLPACPRAAARRLASAAAEEEGDEGDAPGAEAWEYDAAER